MKNKILKLRSKGKSYGQIKKELNCSKGTISYYCGEGQKNKSAERQRKNRKKLKSIINRKIERFLLRNKIRNYKRRSTASGGYSQTKSKINYDSAYKKIINNPYCYLTGRKIDLYDVLSYQLDHHIPTSKGGKNTLPNMKLSCEEANQAKRDMVIKDFIQLCVEICQYNGYKVLKK